QALAAALFFHAEDGIRDLYVTGVQTCALPIYTFLGSVAMLLSFLGIYFAKSTFDFAGLADLAKTGDLLTGNVKWIAFAGIFLGRSEERRVGKECRSRGRRGLETTERETTNRTT